MAKKKSVKRSKHKNFMPSESIHPSILIPLVCLIGILITLIIFGNAILNTT